MYSDIYALVANSKQKAHTDCVLLCHQKNHIHI